MSGKFKCIICNHPNRLDIDRAIASGRTMASISREYGVPESSVMVHRDKHLSHQLVTAFRKKTEIESMDIFGNIDELITRTKKILTEAENKGKHELALKAIAEARNSYELLCKIAAYYHQAKADELSMNREQIESEIEEQNIAKLQKNIQILTPEEQELYFQLNLKMLNQDERMPFNPPEKRILKPVDEVSGYMDIAQEEIMQENEGKQGTTQDIDVELNEDLAIHPIKPKKIGYTPYGQSPYNPNFVRRQAKEMDKPNVRKKLGIIRMR
ncbi:MAG: hypothetical protein JXB00_09445 [Bacteroidales bacterium]|nr:hypothetical protein [Bacteroidales bacterium]